MILGVGIGATRDGADIEPSLRGEPVEVSSRDDTLRGTVLAHEQNGLRNAASLQAMLGLLKWRGVRLTVSEFSGRTRANARVRSAATRG